MNDDPTRIMRNGDRDPRQDPHYSPDDQKRHLRWLLVGLLAVIVGLVIAIFVISGSDDSEPASSGTTDVQTTTDSGGVVPVTPTGDTGATSTTDTDSGGVSPTPDTGTTTGTTPDSGGTTPTTPDSGGVTPGGTDSSGTGSQSGGQSGGIGP